MILTKIRFSKKDVFTYRVDKELEARFNKAWQVAKKHTRHKLPFNQFKLALLDIAHYDFERWCMELYERAINLKVSNKEKRNIFTMFKKNWNNESRMTRCMLLYGLKELEKIIYSSWSELESILLEDRKITKFH